MELNSAYSHNASNQPTVADIVENDSILTAQIKLNLERSFIENAVLSNAGVVSNTVVPYRVDKETYLNEPAEKVAEFAEIPVASDSRGELKYAVMEKTAQGIEISHEMILSNDLASVQRQTNKLTNNIVSASVRQLRKALDNADIPTIQASSPWRNKDNSAIDDLMDSVDKISYTDEDKGVFGRTANTILVNAGIATRLFAGDQASRLFNGNVASENPLYKGVLPAQFMGMNVVTSNLLPTDTAYVLSAPNLGFYADLQPLTVTPMYAARGDNGQGGSTMSYRIDASFIRAQAVTAPSAAVKITGIAG